jgi:tetratricopeptide (TPR) repeat protein
LPDSLLVDLGDDGNAEVLTSPGGGPSELVSRTELVWPLDADALEDLRWYLEDYLRAPFGVWEDRGPAVQARLASWGNQVFASVFGPGPARDAYKQARSQGLPLVLRSGDPGLLGLPWELMLDGNGPVALGPGGICRSLPVAGAPKTLAVPGGRLRVLMVISRPAASSDVSYQMVARPLLERLDAVRGEVDLTVLRPPTFGSLRRAVTAASAAGEPFHIVHFDGHGVMPGRAAVGVMMNAVQEAMLAFEGPVGGGEFVPASRVAAVLAGGQVPVAVLNACQSGAVGKELEASVATALLTAGCAAVVAMAYNVYASAAAEFMAAFYESLFTGSSVGQAVTVGRRRLYEHNCRPSPKGNMRLADWLVPVHYRRREVSFPQARAARPVGRMSLDAALDRIGSQSSVPNSMGDPLAAAGGVFVGRDDLIYELESAARLQHVVVLTGSGGTGKSELAKGFARWWRDTGGVDDPRLTLWHSSEPGVANFGLDGLISRIGLAVIGPSFARLHPSDRTDSVKQLLEQTRILLIWDNFETVRDMPDPAGATPPLDEAHCVQLRDFLHWVRDRTRSVVIITSRTEENWLGQVRRIEVGGLNRQEAAEYSDHLLVPYPAARLRRRQRLFAKLLQWLDGHPLAMRLTLPRLDATDVEDLLAELQGTMPLPALPGDIESDRLSSLQACITYSFRHLADQTLRLLPALSLFHGVADHAILTAFSAAEGVPERFGGAGEQEWTAVLQNAVQVGLVTDLGNGMHRIHPALPGFLAAVWQAQDPVGYESEREACKQALYSACAEFSRSLTGERNSGDAASAYEVTGLLRSTMCTMLSHALDHQAWAAAEDIIRVLDDYWDTRGLREEATAWAEQILAATAPGIDAPTADTPRGELWLYTSIRQANRQMDYGRADHAAQAYHDALAYLRDQPRTRVTRTSVSIISLELGSAALKRGSLDEAEDWYRKSLTIQEELGDRPRMARCYHQLGITARDRGQMDEAEEWYHRSLAIKQELGDQPGIAATYHHLSINAYLLGRLEKADEWSHRSLSIYEDLGDRPHMATCYGQLSTIARRRGQVDESDEWSGRALTIREDLRDGPGMAASYHHLGNTAYQRERLDDAEDWYHRALAIREELGDRPSIASSYHDLGNTAYRQGRLDDAEAWYRKSLAIREELGDRPFMAENYQNLGTTAYARGRLDEAEDWYYEALAIREEFGDRPGMTETYGHLGIVREARQDLHQALVWTIRSVSLFDGFPSEMTGIWPMALTRLTRRLGMSELEQLWPQVTGGPVPESVRNHISDYQERDRGAQ